MGKSHILGQDEAANLALSTSSDSIRSSPRRGAHRKTLSQLLCAHRRAPAFSTAVALAVVKAQRLTRARTWPGLGQAGGRVPARPRTATSACPW